MKLNKCKVKNIKAVKKIHLVMDFNSVKVNFNEAKRDITTAIKIKIKLDMLSSEPKSNCRLMKAPFFLSFQTSQKNEVLQMKSELIQLQWQ